MSRLTSWTLAAGTTRTAWQPRQPIRRGRLTARSTVFGQAVFQLLDAGVRLGQLLFQRLQFSNQGFEKPLFFSQGLQFFFFRHECTLAYFLSFGKSAGDLSSYVLEQVVEHGFYTVLLLDSFDNITHNEHFDLDFFSFLRAQTRCVSYVTASVAPLHDICRQDVRQSPFFNIFSTHEVGPLTSDEAQALVTIPVRRASYAFSDFEVEWLLSLAGRHPFFIQRICHWLLEEKYQQDNNAVDLSLVEEQVYNELLPHFKSLWRELNEDQQNQLEGQMQQEATQQKILPELCESTLFRHFVCETLDIRLSEITTHITPQDVEKLLDNLDSLQTLGESNMRYFKIVSTRLKNHSASEVGKIIREILTEAFEHTRGSGSIRQESSGDWRFYNILYYRYFGPHHYRKLTSEQLVACLNYTSTRNYFRDRKKAIEALLETLLEMEREFSV